MMKSVLLALLVTGSAFAGETGRNLQPDLHPADSWEFTLESGYLWNIGSNTSIDYEIIPTQFVLHSPVMFDLWQDDTSGSRLVVRNRFALITESIVEGPEDFYFGLSAAPSLEYWFPDRKTSIYFAIGGGLGYTDSTSVYDGQGQDFTLNWFSELGLRRQITADLSLRGGAYFTHHSNGGQTEPNPGIDAFGFTIGAGWRW